LETVQRPNFTICIETSKNANITTVISAVTTR